MTDGSSATRAPRALSTRRTAWLALAAGALATGALACDSGSGGKKPKDGEDEVASVIPEGGNLLGNSDFSGSTILPWNASFTPPANGTAENVDGALCLTVTNAGAAPWDAQVRHREMVIEKGHTYTVSFKVWSDKATGARIKIGMAGPPYPEYWRKDLGGLSAITPEPRVITETFTMTEADDQTAEFTFHVGGNFAKGGVPFTVCIDDVYLTDKDFTPPEAVAKAPPPTLRVNQVGYLPFRMKSAVLVSDAESPKGWEVVDGKGNVVTQGETVPFGKDDDSGDAIHIIDFTDLQTVGKDYKVRVDDGESTPFDIAPDIYHQMKFDAIKYFYHNRSGIEILEKYVGGKQWARPAGHLPDMAPCGEDLGCKYTLDVTGGWYDAGDHGKYVVNGGIALWTMLNQYERMVHLKKRGSLSDYDDGGLNLPESGNKVPDILDEARWELEWMTKMIVPEGEPLAGMVHHKIHDKEWTGLGLAPHEASSFSGRKIERFLRPASTAATLNFAAVAAMGARIWKTIDPEFSKSLLTKAEAAWAAAQAHPDIFADKADTIGGGPYDDTELDDEFFWAAAELYIATGNQDYWDFCTRSTHYASVPTTMGGDGGGTPSSMTWQKVSALGSISLALVPSGISKSEQKKFQSQIALAADRYLEIMATQGYHTPMQSVKRQYPWGSNSFVINNLLVMALAFDFTGNRRYADGVTDGMGYILGRNPLSQCYVSGYGEFPLTNPHHRFWSYQVDKRYPQAPPGCLSGGPNSGLQDPYVKAAGIKDCAPQKCFVDHIESWSTNEITINWNAPLAWVTGWLDEIGGMK